MSKSGPKNTPKIANKAIPGGKRVQKVNTKSVTKSAHSVKNMNLKKALIPGDIRNKNKNKNKKAH